MLKVSMNRVVDLYNEVTNGYWFSKDTMRFFNSRLPKIAYLKGDKYYFISSEKSFGGDRKYTIRKMDENGNIDTYGAFNQLYRNEARSLLAKILECKVKDL